MIDGIFDGISIMPDDPDSFPPIRGRSDALTQRAASPSAVPPHPLDKNWYVNVDGTSYGPYSGHEIRRMAEKGQVMPTDFLCAEGATSWVQAKNDPVLGGIFTPRSTQTQQTVTAPVTANGGTVVQVTNNIPNLAHAALLMDEGPAGAKSPGIALLLSLLICGVGQMYNGQVAKGILMLLGCAFLWVFLLGWIIWIWSMIDAYSTAKEMNLRYQRKVLAGLIQ
jgi:TM2 domain-containing membrane protein YozV